MCCGVCGVRCCAGCVPCLACVWRALFARACCGAGAGTHPMSGWLIWPRGGLSCCPTAASVRSSGVCVRGGGSVSLSPCVLSSPPAPVRCPALRPLPRLYCVPAWLALLADARSVCCAVCAVSGAAGSRSPVCPLGVLCCVCGVRRRWPPCTPVPARCAVLCVRCPAPLAAVHRFARSACCAVFAVSGAAGCRSHVCPFGVLCCVCGVWRRWLPFTAVPARCAVLCVRCPAPLAAVHWCACAVCCAVCAVSGAAGCRAPVCSRGVLGVRCPAPLAAVHRCARSVCCAVCAVYGAAGCCSPVCWLCVLCCVCGVRRSWVPFTGVLARCAVSCVRCPTPLAVVHRCAGLVCCAVCAVSGAAGCRSPVCPLGVLCRVCGVRRRWLLCTPVLARCAACAVSGAAGCRAPVYPFSVLCCMRGVRHRWLLFTVHPTHGAGTRPNRTQLKTAARKTTLNAGQCVHQPREGRGRNRQAPPGKKNTEGGGGKGAKTAHSRQTARQHHQRRPNRPPRRHRGQDPQRGTGGPPTQNRQHQARNSGPPGKGTPKQAEKEKKESHQPSPKERGWGDRDHKARVRNTHKKKGKKKKQKRKRHTPTTQPRRAGHSRDPGPAHTPTPHAGTGNGRGQAGHPRNHTRPKSRPTPNPNHEHHKQPTLEGQHHKPCPNTTTQDPSQDWRG